jgi:hypothetical protein
MDDSVELDLRPRFPLFGGWKTPTHMYMGRCVESINLVDALIWFNHKLMVAKLVLKPFYLY